MSVKLRKAKVRVPVRVDGKLQWGNVSTSTAEQLQYQAYLKSLPHSARKPGRTLGAVWMDDFVQQRRPVNLCEECWRKYDQWWKSYNYTPDFRQWKRGECDGCSRSFVLMVGFYPAEQDLASIINSSSRRQHNGMGR